MDDSRLQEAAALIRAHWRSGEPLALPAHLRPATRAEGYAVQAHIDPALPYGWKIAATSLAGQRHIGVGGPLAGRILPDRVLPETATLPFAPNRMRVAEAEFAFRMSRDLPPRAAPYTIPDVLDAVATLHPAIEIPDSRFPDFATAGEAQLIADLACGHLFVLGAAATADWRAIDLAAHPVTARVCGGPPQPGIGRNVLGDPRIALAWLANELSGLGLTLHAGQVVTTGTCVTPLPIAAHDTVAADFGPLGRIAIRFGA